MNLREYINSLPAELREAYAVRCGTTVAYLYQLAGNHSKASGPLARKLAHESGYLVSLQELRPDIFGDPPAPAAATVGQTPEQAGASYG